MIVIEDAQVLAVLNDKDKEARTLSVIAELVKNSAPKREIKVVLSKFGGSLHKGLQPLVQSTVRFSLPYFMEKKELFKKCAPHLRLEQHVLLARKASGMSAASIVSLCRRMTLCRIMGRCEAVLVDALRRESEAETGAATVNLHQVHREPEEAQVLM